MLQHQALGDAHALLIEHLGDERRYLAERDDLAAVGLLLRLWRRTDGQVLERLHRNRPELTDMMMLRVNVATFKALRPAVQGDFVDLDAAFHATVDPRRLVFDGRSRRPVADVFADDWSAVQADVANSADVIAHVIDSDGPCGRGGTDYLAFCAVMLGLHLFGCPWWPNLVRAAVDVVVPRTPAWKDLAVTDPEMLDDAGARWLITASSAVRSDVISEWRSQV